MNEKTREVVAALAALHDELPSVIDALRHGRLSVLRQHEFAAMLIEAGESLDDHADAQAPATNGHADDFTATESDRHDDECPPQ
ncbi:hypothetical protein [Qaidamihabitans albus]|uniref:hypothetical protein n=1 Tax=Qaidamihabitans albus TaxID=2795733 RepID=UPI0018F1EBA1|nr:hypothetical protein [Qaidamihabitans albus]